MTVTRHLARSILWSTAMYDMYPEWGPARHEFAKSASEAALQAALDLRDNGGQRPDDN
jgi:hypothetical protein